MTAESAEGPPQSWAPLSVRHDPSRLEVFQAVRDGVPEGARRVLVEWCDRAFGTDADLPFELKTRLFEMSTNQQLPDYVVSDSGNWEGFLRQDDDLLLEAIDFALRWTDESRRAQLSFILRQSRSEYRVGKDADDRWALQKTYSDELVELVESIAAQSGRAAKHLRIAWSNIAGRQPDPDKACWEATKAVEVAAKPTIAPNDDTTHLSKMLGEMKANPDRWEIGLTPDESIERLMGMMRLVLQEGRRHGDDTQPIGVSSEAAEIVVQTAVVLVNWFESGFVRRVSS